jgi:hypothetical protein
MNDDDPTLGCRDVFTLFILECFAMSIVLALFLIAHQTGWIAP